MPRVVLAVREADDHEVEELARRQRGGRCLGAVGGIAVGSRESSWKILEPLYPLSPGMSASTDLIRIGMAVSDPVSIVSAIAEFQQDPASFSLTGVSVWLPEIERWEVRLMFIALSFVDDKAEHPADSGLVTFLHGRSPLRFGSGDHHECRDGSGQGPYPTFGPIHEWPPRNGRDRPSGAGSRPQ